MEQVERPLVTLFVTTYNNATTLGDTLESLVNQSYENLDINIYDNCSEDGTVAVAREIQSRSSRPIKIHVNPENLGGEGNFNLCIQSMYGEYSGIFHADDIYDPDMVARQVETMEQDPEVGGVLCHARLIDLQGKVTGERFLPQEFAGHSVVKLDFPELFSLTLKYSNFLTCPSALLRREIFQDQIKAWNSTDFHTSSDLDTWLRLSSVSKLALLTERPLMSYRLSNASYSFNLHKIRTDKHPLFLVLNHYLNKPAVASLLTERDWACFHFLLFKDSMFRSYNVMKKWRKREPFPPLEGDFSKIFSVALSSRYHIRFFILSLGILVFRTALFPLFGSSRR